MCERCPELEERIAWLESELGIQRDLDRTARLKAAMGGGRVSGRGQAAHLVDALYAARGRPLTKLQLLEAMPSPGGNDDRNENLANVIVCVARAALGRDTIETLWGKGYRLTPAGMAKVSAILGERAEARAA